MTVPGNALLMEQRVWIHGSLWKDAIQKKFKGLGMVKKLLGKTVNSFD